MTIKFGNPCSCPPSAGGMSYDPNCRIHGPLTPRHVVYPNSISSTACICQNNVHGGNQCPQHGLCDCYAGTWGGVITDSCELHGDPKLITCFHCDNTGLIDAEVIQTTTFGGEESTFEVETTWCPWCEKGEEWKELLNGS